MPDLLRRNRDGEGKLLNWLHGVLHDPRRGWDPVAASYAGRYDLDSVVDPGLINRFERVLGGLTDKSIADLGSGPGHYALEFAKRGGRVTCIDVSGTYLSMAEARLTAAGFTAHYALGYMDSINEITSEKFDGIFSNVSWNYCMNDLTFARKLLRAVKPGGVIMIRETNEAFEPNPTMLRSLIYWLNRTCFWKIGHPHPPRGRIAMAFERLRRCEVTTDYLDPLVDLVVVINDRRSSP